MLHARYFFTHASLVMSMRLWQSPFHRFSTSSRFTCRCYLCCCINTIRVENIQNCSEIRQHAGTMQHMLGAQASESVSMGCNGSGHALHPFSHGQLNALMVELLLGCCC
jgi:hypothetical protein